MHTCHGTDYATLRALVADLESNASHARQCHIRARNRYRMLRAAWSVAHLHGTRARATSYLLLARAYASVARELARPVARPYSVTSLEATP